MSIRDSFNVLTQSKASLGLALVVRSHNYYKHKLIVSIDYGLVNLCNQAPGHSIIGCVLVKKNHEILIPGHCFHISLIVNLAPIC